MFNYIDTRPISVLELKFVFQCLQYHTNDNENILKLACTRREFHVITQQSNIIFSFRYSSLSPKLKEEALVKWQKKWDKFVVENLP